MRTIITAFLFLLISCYPQKKVQANPEDKATKSCFAPTDKQLKTAAVDTKFCDTSYSEKYNIETRALIRALDTENYDWAAEEIERGADVNQPIPQNGNTPLMLAIFGENIPMITILLEHGADPNIARSDNGKTAASDGATPLNIAASRQNTEIVQLLLEHGADPDIPSSDNGLTPSSTGSTPLILAAGGTNEKGPNIEITKLLLEHGADPNIPLSDNGKTRSSNGLTPLILASGKGDYEIVKLLLEAGADPNLANSNNRKWPTNVGMTSLSRSVYKRYHNIVKLLLDSGANPNKDIPYLKDWGMSLLDYAELWSSKDMVNLLKEAGAKNSNELNTFYRIALMVRRLPRYGQLGLLALLIIVVSRLVKWIKKYRKKGSELTRLRKALEQ